MNIKTSNIWKAWITTVIGLFIPIITTAGTKIIDGSINWHDVKLSLIGTGVLALTDLLSEVKKSLNDKADETNSK